MAADPRPGQCSVDDQRSQLASVNALILSRPKCRAPHLPPLKALCTVGAQPIKSSSLFYVPLRGADLGYRGGRRLTFIGNVVENSEHPSGENLADSQARSAIFRTETMSRCGVPKGNAFHGRAIGPESHLLHTNASSHFPPPEKARKRPNHPQVKDRTGRQNRIRDLRNHVV